MKAKDRPFRAKATKAGGEPVAEIESVAADESPVEAEGGDGMNNG